MVAQTRYRQRGDPSGARPAEPPGRRRRQLDPQRRYRCRGQPVLDLEDFAERALVALCPQGLFPCGLDQLDVDPHRLAETLHAADDHIGDVQFAGDLRGSAPPCRPVPAKSIPGTFWTPPGMPVATKASWPSWLDSGSRDYRIVTLPFVETGSIDEYIPDDRMGSRRRRPVVPVFRRPHSVRVVFEYPNRQQPDSCAMKLGHFPRFTARSASAPAGRDRYSRHRPTVPASAGFAVHAGLTDPSRAEGARR